MTGPEMESSAIVETRRPGRALGFSLIEVLFALTFLAIGIMAVAAMIPAGTRGITQSRVLTSGLMAAQVKLEDLKGTPYAVLTAGTFSDTTSVFTRTCRWPGARKSTSRRPGSIRMATRRLS